MPKETFFNLPEEKRLLILDLAIEEFAGNDYKNASVSNIVNRAGIAKGSFYQYFEDKRELYFYLLELAADEKKKFLAERQPPDPQMGLFDYLRWLAREGTRFELQRPRLAQVAYRALFTDRPFGDQPFQDLRASVNAYYRSLVEVGIAQGSIDTRIDRDLAVFYFESLFNDFGRFILQRRDIDPQALAKGEVAYQQIPFEGLVEQLVDLLEHGLAPRPVRRPADEPGFDQ